MSALGRKQTCTACDVSRWEGNEAMSLFRLGDCAAFREFRAEGRAPAPGHSQLGGLGDHNTRMVPAAR